MTKKSKLSSSRSSPPHTRSRAAREHISSPQTRSRAAREHISSPQTRSRAAREHISSPQTRSRAAREHISSPQTRSRAAREHISSPQTRSRAAREHISSPLTRSGALPEPNSSPLTRSRAFPKHIFSLLTSSRSKLTPKPSSRAVPGLNSSPLTRSETLAETDGTPRTSFSLGPITPIIRTVSVKSISLTDWWLTKKNKKKNSLCVEGYETKDGYEVRVFSSGPISKRLDCVTLETSDGITVSLDGFIDRSRSVRNGVSSDICNHFILGFPYDWKVYADDGYVEEEEDKGYFDDFEFDEDVDWLVYDDLMQTAPAKLQEKMMAKAFASLDEILCTPNTKKSDNEKVVGVKTRSVTKRVSEKK